MRGTKYIISQHGARIFYSSDQYWANQLYTTEHATKAVTIVKNMCFNNRYTLSLYKSGIKSSSFNIDRDSKLAVMTVQCQDC